MNRNSSMIAAFVALVTFFGFTNFSRSNQASPGADAKASTSQAGGKAAAASRPYSPCMDIVYRLHRLIDDRQSSSDSWKLPAAMDSWELPASCYAPGRLPEKRNTVKAFSDVTFAIATVPNPVTTHLPLLFDRMVESIQQAAQDSFYAYDSSWFPWNPDSQNGYSGLADQQAAEEQKRIHDGQPGVMVFRRSRSADPYGSGLVVFLVGEQPTAGINDEQFQNAVSWLELLGGLHAGGTLRILGPTFSGSLPSLRRDLERGRIAGPLADARFDISSGTVSAGRSYEDFKGWIENLPNHSTVRTATENDAVMVDRLCQYLDKQGYAMKGVALLSEDETAFGARGQETGKHGVKLAAAPASDICPAAIRLYYPRDIAMLRSAYESQSILTPAKSQTDNNSPASTLRGDLSEPANDEHDTVRRFSGQLEPLAQESVLLDIANRLEEKQVHFVVIRSTSSLDQIFLSQFLRRAYPSGRVIIDGADLLFSRGTDGRSLRGVMLLSTYPLLASEQDWTSSLVHPSNTGYRTFGEDTAEANYIAARGLFSHDVNEVPIRDYGPPAWALERHENGANQSPPTWLTVVGHRQTWPLAVLSDPPSTDAKSILVPASERGLPFRNSGDKNPLRLPLSMWFVLVIYVVWTMVHAYYCRFGSIKESLRARAYFAPLSYPQHSILVAAGSLILAMVPLSIAAASGLFAWRFHDEGTGVGLSIVLISGLFFTVLGCWYSFQLPIVRASNGPLDRSTYWRRRAGWGGLLGLMLFACVHLYLGSLLTNANRIPAYWRSVHLTCGVSPLAPQLLLFLGGYLWFWCSLRGLAHFGDDRPLLPALADLPKMDEIPLLPMFSREKAGDQVEKAARPLTRWYALRWFGFFLAAVAVAAIGLEGFSIRTLGELAFGRFIFVWVCLYVAVILADAFEIWQTWSELRRLLVYLDRLPLRRTLRSLKGLEWGSIWKMSGNVLEERYRVMTFQLESLTHLENASANWKPTAQPEIALKNELVARLTDCRTKAIDFTRWYVSVNLKRDSHIDLKLLVDFQRSLASAAGTAIKNILIPAWHCETESLIFDRPDDGKRTKDGGKEDEDDITLSPGCSGVKLHVQTAEEFFVLPYLAFIQNILGRIRTIALGTLWLFVATTLAVSSYPFDPLTILGAIFLGVFLIYGGVSALIYAQMSRDATLSHITNTEPGSLGWDFWGRLLTFGGGPLIGLLTTLFPAIGDFVFSWLQPGTQALK